MSPSTSWGGQAPPNTSGEKPISVLLAGEVGSRLLAWQQSITMDARFRVAALANDPTDLQAKLAYSPEVIFLDAKVFHGPQPLMETLAAVTGAVYIVLPPEVSTAKEPEMRELPEKLKAIASVKQVYIGDAPIPDMLQRAYTDALTLRRTIAAPVSWQARQQAATSVTGMRVITIWNRAGGAGRTTIAAALGIALARRGVRSLLIGLDAPDVMPLHLGLKPEPNVLSWFATPTLQTIQNAAQHVGDLDVLVGFPDILSEDTGQKAEEKNSVSALATTAAWGQYGAILLDAPAASGLAMSAVVACNTWVIVARPTLADAWASVDALRTVTQRAAGQHRIVPGNIFVVLNMRGSGMMSPNDWHQSADATCRQIGLQTGFPPVAAVIPFVPGIPLNQDAGRPVIDSDDEFARPIHGLADMLFGAGAPADVRKGGKRFTLGGLSIKVKG
ncbi:MAG: cellulose synthase operon protein YhjQ/BcsQ [Anaerolineales bacterium]